MEALSDTIVAVATAAGRGAVGIVRLSGADADAIARQLCGDLPPPRRAGLRAVRGADGSVIDDAVVLHFAAPTSFTGETVVEIQAHGAPVVLDAIVAAAVASGARRAEPGEFSRRAFENGRMDLAQAEAVADLIAAGSVAAARAARASLDGRFSRRVLGIAEALEQLRVRVEGAIDFSDEDLPELDPAALVARLADIQADLAALLADARRGQRLARGARVVLAGAPNAGKSTLLNRLCGEEVAIVTEIAGTTRDVLQHELLIGGLPVRIHDTAGLREARDPVEAEGVRRSRQYMAEADLLLLLLDDQHPQRPPLPPDLAVPELVVYNKCDLSGRPAGKLPAQPGACRISARDGDGVEQLLELLAQRLSASDLSDSPFSARQRHVEGLAAAQTRLQEAAVLLRSGEELALTAQALREARQALDGLLGRGDSEQLLGAIFSSFCIGK